MKRATGSVCHSNRTRSRRIFSLVLAAGVLCTAAMVPARGDTTHYGSVRYGSSYGDKGSSSARVLRQIPPSSTYIRRGGKKYYKYRGNYYEKRFGRHGVVYVQSDPP